MSFGGFWALVEMFLQITSALLPPNTVAGATSQIATEIVSASRSVPTPVYTWFRDSIRYLKDRVRGTKL